MMAGEIRGRAIYDFEGDASQGELSFKAGDEIVVFRQDIGEGWWEGQVRGKTGLFPESYIDLADGESGEEWEDEQEDWEDRPPPTAAAAIPFAGESSSDPPTLSSRSTATSLVTSTTPHPDNFGRATLRRTVNRFSGFVKTGAESFILGALKEVHVDQPSSLHVQMTVDGIVWVPNPNPYGSIVIQRNGIKTKFRGIKKFESLLISGAVPSGAVERRYKHFEWLHARLQKKYSCVCVPPLPDRQVHTKYGENAADKRQIKLQQWINRICRHPVLSRDVLSLRHFLTHPTSDLKNWKNGKRLSERDELVGGQFFKLICQDAACPKTSDKDIETFSDVVREMSAVVRKSQDVIFAHAERMNSGFRREYKRISECIKRLSGTFSKGIHTNGDAVKLSMALGQCAQTYDTIAELWAVQPVNDQLPLLEGLKVYGSLLSQFGDSISSCREASQKVVEIDATETAEPPEKEAVKTRRDIIHTLVLCEVAHFHKQRREDFRDLMKAYLHEQIIFYEKITEQLKQAKHHFDQLPY